MKGRDVFYADHNSTTPCDPAVTQVVVECLERDFGNPNSAHSYGRRGSERIEQARRQIALCVDCDPEEVVLTSGATEAINLFVKGLAYDRQLRFLVSEIEHPAIWSAVNRRITSGGCAYRLPLTAEGRFDCAKVMGLGREGVDVVILQAVNPETGVIQGTSGLTACLHERGAISLVDAAQALWKVPVSFRKLDCDAMVISAHKAYGPKGAGALIVRQPVRGLISKLIDGGGSTQPLRSGTENVPAYAGFGACCHMVSEQASMWRDAVTPARDLFEKLLEDGANSNVYCKLRHLKRVCNTSSVTFQGVDAGQMLAQMHNVAASYGSACASGSFEPSGTLLAFGLTRDEAQCTIRFSFGRDFTTIDARLVAERVLAAYRRCELA